MNDLFLNRREAILATSSLFVAGMLRSANAQEVPKDLIFRTEEPRNGEPELAKLVESWITPTKHFYVRSHAPNPTIAADDYRLKVEGLVRDPISLSLGELKKYVRRSTTATLTCAGNRRAEFNSEGKVGGVQWGAGAIGNAQWAGYLLADVLKHVGVLENAKHVWFEGLDQIPKGDQIIPFGGSIPIEKAMLTDGPGASLIADQMNSQPLTADHGYPLRTLIPGYIGARSVKWLGKIVVSDRPSPNHYLATAYKVVRNTNSIDWSESGPIYRYPVNAVICNPSAGATLPAGELALAGYALPSGRPGTQIKAIFVSANGGKTWQRATLTGKNTEFCWQLWKAQVKVDAATNELIVRATDNAGQFMPYRVPWNAKGYLQNSWHRLPVRTEA